MEKETIDRKTVINGTIMELVRVTEQFAVIRLNQRPGHLIILRLDKDVIHILSDRTNSLYLSRCNREDQFFSSTAKGYSCETLLISNSHEGKPERREYKYQGIFNIDHIEVRDASIFSISCNSSECGNTTSYSHTYLKSIILDNDARRKRFHCFFKEIEELMV